MRLSSSGWLGAVIVLAFLSACSPLARRSAVVLPATEAVTRRPPLRSPTAVVPTRTSTSSPSLTTPIQAPPGASPSVDSFRPPTPTLEPWAVLCSPLKDHSLTDLVEIISRPYDPPPEGREEDHHGVDFSYYRRRERLSIRGVEVRSVLPGRVAASLADKFPYGNALIVETPLREINPVWVSDLDLYVKDGESLYVLYAHLESPPEAALGQDVGACQSLGMVGSSGNAGVAHLHLETRIGPGGERFQSMA
jgi:murein DD-endopeptidase MepM/ murein hydrolase activator NlpD